MLKAYSDASDPAPGQIPLEATRSKILVLASQNRTNQSAVDALRAHGEVVEIATIDQAIDSLRKDHFSAIFSDSADFLPLERALVSQQANLVLNTIGEGVCIVDCEGRCCWMNKRMQLWPARKPMGLSLWITLPVSSVACEICAC